MKHYTVYDPTTGKILRSGVCAPGDVSLQAGPGEAVSEMESRDDEHFVVAGRRTDRAENPIQLSSQSILKTEKITLTVVPAGCTVTIRGAGDLTAPVAEVLDDLEFTEAGVYELTFEAWPFKPYTVKVRVR